MKPFISAKTAFELFNQENVLFIDAQYDFNQPEEYSLKIHKQNHIPGSIYLSMLSELSGPQTPATGRHPLPSLEHFKALLEEMFISKNLHIICYDNTNGGYTARIWFMLFTLGYEKVQILEGGLSKWIADGYPTTSEPTIRTGEKISLSLPSDWSFGIISLVDFKKVSELVDSGFTGLIDSRDSNRFHGQASTLDKVGGHIPGASNRWWKANISDGDGILRNDKELKKEFDLLFINNKPEDSIVYCGSGVTACFNLAVMKQLGFQEPKLYIGSFSDWEAHSTRFES